MSIWTRYSIILLTLVLIGCSKEPTSYLWEIGKPNGDVNDFDTNQGDDPLIVEFNVGDPVGKFPHSLAPVSGNQRSEIQITFSDAIPANSKLLVRWSPGGSESEDQFEISYDGRSIGRSPARKGASPYPWFFSKFSLPPGSPAEQVISLKHIGGDGLELDYVAVAVY